MKGFVPTPTSTVDLMVAKLLDGVERLGSRRVLDPGCADGTFIDGVIRHCSANGLSLPHIVGVELDPQRARTARRRFAHLPQVEIREADFLAPSDERFDLIVGNPPYVSILGLDADERQAYRDAYRVARGRFDLYLLFFEQALRMLSPNGRLVFITPEKYLYVETARPLRELMLRHQVGELCFVGEETFESLVTYPLVTTIDAAPPSGPTQIVRRDGITTSARIASPDSWLPAVNGFAHQKHGVVLNDVALRVSCGVATGADHVYVIHDGDLSAELREFAYPTVSGRQIAPTGEISNGRYLLAPYDAEGRLLPERQLGALGRFLRQPERRTTLEARTCAARKPWFAYHDNFPLGEMLRPKLLCKDITETPFFVVDETGTLVPRHSVYYIVPADPADLYPLAEYLNSTEATAWLRAHCQRAARGFLRMQSHVLKQLPLPPEFAPRIGALSAITERPQAQPA